MAELPGDFVIIGGLRVDAAVNLAAAGKRSTVSRRRPLEVATPDPSTELAPYTAAARGDGGELRDVAAAPSPLRATAVEAVDVEGGGFVVRAAGCRAEAPKNPLRVPGSRAAAPTP